MMNMIRTIRITRKNEIDDSYDNNKNDNNNDNEKEKKINRREK